MEQEWFKSCLFIDLQTCANNGDKKRIFFVRNAKKIQLFFAKKTILFPWIVLHLLFSSLSKSLNLFFFCRKTSGPSGTKKEWPKNDDLRREREKNSQKIYSFAKMCWKLFFWEMSANSQSFDEILWRKNCLTSPSILRLPITRENPKKKLPLANLANSSEDKK